MNKAIQRLVRVLPRALLSRITGFLVRLRLPPVIMRPVLRMFVKLAAIDMSESSTPLSDFRSIEELFIRRLKPDARTISGGLSSPCDGMVTLSQKVENGSLVQAKGITYSVEELLTDRKFVLDDTAASAVTIYLSPRDYHRVHSPVNGTVTQVAYFPGDLWPVNDTFRSLVPKLFVKNERLVIRLEIAGGGVAHVVMVGALNVGRMSTPFMPNFRTNSRANRHHRVVRLSRQVCAGDELGVFMLGSTVVLVLDEEAASRFNLTSEERRLKAGEQLNV